MDVIIVAATCELSPLANLIGCLVRKEYEELAAELQTSEVTPPLHITRIHPLILTWG